MKLIIPPPSVALSGLRALKTVANADGNLSDLERQLIQSVQTYILKTDVPIDDLELISPQELADSVTDLVFRDRILHGCILISIIDGDLNDQIQAKSAIVNAYAKAWALEDTALKTLRSLINKHLTIVRLNVTRKGFIGPKLKQTVNQQGLGVLASTFKALIGMENPKIAARYLELEHYPEGTLGKAFFDHIRDNHFGFPGEKGGAPEIIINHDCIHVLGGYGTSVEEEVQVAGFQSGCLNRDPFWGLLFILLEFHLGIRVTPAAAPEIGKVNPDLLFKAFERGTHVNINLFDDLDPWQVFDCNLEELRQEYNILPRT